MRPPTIRRTGAFPSEAPDLSCAVTATGQIIRPNRAFQQAVGLSQETLTGRPLLEFIHPGDRGGVEGAMSWLRDNEGPIVFEARWRHADGTYHWLEWTVRSGSRDGLLHAGLRDVTRWKQDEALALAHARVLEAVVVGLPLEETFAHITALLDALGMDLFPALHLLDPAKNALAFVAGADFPEAFRRALETLPLADGPGAAVVAARDKRFVVSADLGQETHWRGRRELPLLHGLRAEWAHPVIDPSGALLGTVTTFLTQPAGPRPRDRQILALAAQLVATALGRFRSTDVTREDVERLRTELAALEQRRAEEVAALEARQASERAALEARLHQAEASAQLSSESLRELRADHGERAALEVQVAGQREELAAVRAELEEARAEREAARNAASESEHARREVADTLDEVQRRLDQLALHKEELESRVVEAEVARELLQGDIEQLRADRELKKGRSADLKKQVADLELQCEVLRRDLEEAQEAVTERDSLAGRLAEATAETEAVEQRLADLASLLADARMAAADGRQAMEEVIPLRAQLADSERRRADLETALASAQTEPPARSGSADLDEDFAALHARLAEADAARGRLEQELAALRSATAPAATDAPAALLRTLFEGSAAAMLAVDENGQLVFWNRTAASVLGRSETDVLGHQLASLTGETNDEPGTNSNDQSAHRRTWHRPDGTAVPLMVSSVPLPTRESERPLTLLVALPIGEGEASRVRTLSSLDHLPGLAGGIARQVAELLAEIVAGTSNARAPRGRQAQKPLEAIEYVARRASELVRHLVVCAGEEIVEGDTLDLTLHVDRLRGELAAMLPPEIELHFRLTPHLPPMVGDAGQLRQVLAHLVTNSAEALEGRRGVISVATGLVDADRQYLSRTYFDDGLPEGRYLFLEVSDTGRGMDADTLAHLFEAQFSTKGAGRGLGLALVLGIVRAHHGALQVYSKRDVGTTVRVLLPTAGARGRYTVESQEAPAVLLVDHDSAVRGTAARILEHWGIGVVEASDVNEGVEQLREQPSLQLVVMESHLAEGDAPEALRNVRQDVRVLVAGEENGAGHTGNGLSRPYAPVELVAAVRAALVRSPAPEVF